jgi:hypothetical protein
MPWVLGGCGCLLLLLILLGVLGYGVYRARKKTEAIASQYQSARPAVNAAPGGSSSSRSSTARTAGMKTYTNVKEKLPAKLQPNFVAFSFDYPASFVLQPQSEINFVKVEQYTADGPGNTAENFAVGTASFSIPAGGALNDLFGSVIYDQLLDQLGAQFARGFHNYKEVKKVNETVAGIKCRASLFQADLNDPAKTLVYGKTIVVHPPGKEKGVTIIMLATSNDPDVESAADLGVKGETADILRSFRLL